MAKAGVLAMTRSLAVEWGPHGIRCNAVAPGASRRRAPAPGWRRRAAQASAGAHDPAGPGGRARELTDVCAFLVSDLASYVSGDCMVVDGGKRWMSGAAQGDTAAMLGFDDAWWDGLRAR